MKTHRAWGLGTVLAVAALLMAVWTISAATPGDDKIDWDKARQLRQKSKQGGKLTAEEQAYLENAMKALQQQRGQKEEPAPGGKDSVGLTPLPELQGTYKGESGGLYGDGKNEPPEAHQAAARKETAKIRPLDAQGQPAPDGKIVLFSIGMSNTTQEYQAFKALAERDPQKSPRVVIVDGAQGGQAAEQ